MKPLFVGLLPFVLVIQPVFAKDKMKQEKGQVLHKFKDVKKHDGLVRNVIHSKEKGLFAYKVKDAKGKTVPMSRFKGKVMLVVNTASKCGYTYQYKGLQGIQKKYEKKGFTVVAFPANNFGKQEPGTDKSIQDFCKSRFNVNFPVFSKISVAGKDKHPLYEHLTNKKTNPTFGGEISWNFNKFLISRKGEILSRFGSGEEPDGKKIAKEIEKALTK